MALELLIVSFVIGAMFGGIGFKVMIVIPATLIAMLLTLMAGVAEADHFWSIIITMILVGAAVQIGYLTGLVVRARITSMRQH